mmetsp:Transcript_998/g.1424  ORF Transcript_998/g.1424 Transcript_998/m.1424 type:complete len:552 (+) Transcript_998:263-1918(+)
MTMIMWVLSPLAGMIASMLLQLLCEALLTCDLRNSILSTASSSSSSLSVSCIVVPVLWTVTLTVTCLFMFMTGPEPIRISNGFYALCASVATAVLLTIVRYIYIIIVTNYNDGIGSSSSSRFNRIRISSSSRNTSASNRTNRKKHWRKKNMDNDCDDNYSSRNNEKEYVNEDKKMSAAATVGASSSSSAPSASSYIWRRIRQCYKGASGMGIEEKQERGEEIMHNIILKAKRNYFTVSSLLHNKEHHNEDNVNADSFDDYHHTRHYHQDKIETHIISQQQQQQQQHHQDKRIVIIPLSRPNLVNEEENYDVGNDGTATTTSTISSSTSNSSSCCEKRDVLIMGEIGFEEGEELKKSSFQDEQTKKNNNEEEFVSLLVLSALTVAFAHGANDVGNAVGPLAVMLEVLTEGVVQEIPKVPMWCLILGAVGFVVGILTLGQNTIDTVGKRIMHLTPSKSYATQMGAAIAVLLSSTLGMPVSTSHCLVGSVIGVGIAQHISSSLKSRVSEAPDISFSIINKIVVGWLVTIPVAMCLSLIAFNIVRPFSDSFASQH